MHITMSQSETTFGWIYLLFQATILPSLLTTANGYLRHSFNNSELNFLYFLLNFVVVLLIFRRFLRRSFQEIRKRPLNFWVTVILGFLGTVLFQLLFDTLVLRFRPGFCNLNDQGIGVMAGRNYLLMAMGTVLLVPPVEECFYRGLVFGKLRSRSRTAAYLVSAGFFSLIHIVGFLGLYSWPDFLLSFLQYLPAGLILAWAYENAGTVCASVFVHALVNIRAIWLMR